MTGREGRSLVERARAAGVLPAQPSPETLAKIAGILRQHRAELASQMAAERRRARKEAS
jgi:hypothetical protein